MATAVATKPSAPHQQKMKRPPLPNVQTNAIHPPPPSQSPSISSKRPPSAFQHPSSAAANGLNGDVNGLASRLGSRRSSQKPGEPQLRNRSGKAGPDGERRVIKRMTEPYVKTQPYILKRYRNKTPSLIIHLHLTHFRFDQQDGSFSYNSPMKFILEHIKSQTIPHDMLEELQNAQVKFYEGCLIVQVQDHRTSSGTLTPTSTDAAKTEKNVPFSIHNYNEHITPSPYAPYPQQGGPGAEDDKKNENAQATSETVAVSKGKQAEKGPKIFTVVLFPTPLALQEEIYIQANTPDPRNTRKQSTNVPRTPASATIPATPLSAIPPTPSASGPPPHKKVKMSISGSEIHAFESKVIAATAPPLFLDPVDNIDDAHKVLTSLTDPRYKESHPAPKARKRTEAELAADEAIAAREQAFMLIMDERHGASGTAGVKAGTADGEAGAATFEPRFETWQAIKNIRADHEEREQREKDEKRARDEQAAINRARVEHQERMTRQETEQRAAQVAQEQQKMLSAQRQQQVQRDFQTRELQRHQALAASQNQVAHGHLMPNGISQPQNSSPIVRNMTPNTSSSPLLNNISMSSQATSSPARPTSAMQHGHGTVAMVQQRSRQRAPSNTSTPQMNGTPSMQQATPRLPQGSPPMVSSAAMANNVMANQHLNGQKPQLSREQQLDILARQHHQRELAAVRQQQMMQQQQGMQNGSPNSQMSPDRNPAHMRNLQHQAALNQQRQQQQEYQRTLQMHHQNMGNGVSHPNMPNGVSPSQQHPGPPNHPQQHPQQQINLRQLPAAQQQALKNQQSKFYHNLLSQATQKYGGDPQMIPQAEDYAIRRKAGQMAQQQMMLKVRQMQQQQHQEAAMRQMQAQGMNGMNAMNGQGVHGISGQGMTEEQMRQLAGMRQFSQMPHVGGGGVQNMGGMNGMQHNPHMNGGGMGGMQ